MALTDKLASHPPMRCCYIREPPISFRNPAVHALSGLDGVIAEYLLELQSYLGWRCADVIPFPQTDANGFNSAVVNMTTCAKRTTAIVSNSSDCICDIAIGGWFQTAERIGNVDFLPPFSIDSYRTFTTVSNTSAGGDSAGIFEAFDFYAWVGIFALFLMFTFLKMLDVRFANAAPYTPLPGTYTRAARYSHYLQKSRVFFRLRKGIQSTVTRMLLMPDDAVVENGKSTRQWFLNLVLSACALFLILSYEASMTASLVQESVTSRYRTVDDFKTCQILPSRVCIFRGGAMEVYWRKILSQNDCHKENWPIYVGSYEELFQNVADGNCQYGITMEYAIKSESWKRSCGEFVVVGEPLWTAGMAMLLPKGSALTELMSVATVQILRNRSKSTIQKWFDVNGECSLDARSTLSFKKLQFFFILAFSVGGLIFAWMVFDPQRALRSAEGESDNPSRDSCPSVSSQKKAHDDGSSNSSYDESFCKGISVVP